mgnify:FL=1
MNEGLTWESLQISETPIFVNRIDVDPRDSTRNFLIFASTKDLKDNAGCVSQYKCYFGKGVVITIDFNNLKLRACQYPENPDNPNSDYERWYFNGDQRGREDNTSFYIRRKRDAQCFNPSQFKQIQQLPHRECTESDWECDDGYVRERDGACKKIEGHLQGNMVIECVEGHYEIPRGYRKVKGVSCAGRVDYGPVRLPCPQQEGAQKELHGKNSSGVNSPQSVEEKSYQVPYFKTNQLTFEVFKWLVFSGAIALNYFLIRG